MITADKLLVPTQAIKRYSEFLLSWAYAVDEIPDSPEFNVAITDSIEYLQVIWKKVFGLNTLKIVFNSPFDNYHDCVLEFFAKGQVIAVKGDICTLTRSVNYTIPYIKEYCRWLDSVDEERNKVV